MGFSGAKIAPCPPYTPLGTIESSKGLRPSRALRGFFDGAQAELIAAGGVLGAEGGVYLLATGTDEQLAALKQVLKEIA